MAKEITFEIYIQQGGRWLLEARFNNSQKDQAIEEARQIEKQSKLESIKVVREVTTTTTISSRSRSSIRGRAGKMARAEAREAAADRPRPHAPRAPRPRAPRQSPRAAVIRPRAPPVHGVRGRRPAPVPPPPRHDRSAPRRRSPRWDAAPPCGRPAPASARRKRLFCTNCSWSGRSASASRSL